MGGTREDGIRILGRVISRAMLSMGIVVFIISLVWTLVNYYLKTFGINDLIRGDLGYWMAVIGIPCIGMAFVGYSLLSRIMGLRVVLLIVGLTILLYYGWIFREAYSEVLSKIIK